MAEPDLFSSPSPNPEIPPTPDPAPSNDEETAKQTGELRPTQKEQRHTIGGKRFSITPLSSNLDELIYDNASVDLSEPRDREDHDSGDDLGEGSLTDDESYLIETDSDSDVGDSRAGSSSLNSFDITQNIMGALDVSPSQTSYTAPTPKAVDVKREKKRRQREREAVIKGEELRIEKHRNDAQKVIRSMLLMRRAILAANILRTYGLINFFAMKAATNIQRISRGHMGRKKVKAMAGDYVSNLSLKLLAVRCGGLENLVEYVKTLEEANAKLLLDLGEAKSKLMLGTSSGLSSPQKSAAVAESAMSMSQNPKRKAKKWLLFERVGQQWEEKKLSRHAHQRLDVIQATSRVSKEERALERAEKKKFIERTGKGAPNPKVEKVPSVVVKDPIGEIEEIEGKRGLTGDIELEQEEEEEKGKLSVENDDNENGNTGVLQPPNLKPTTQTPLAPPEVDTAAAAPAPLPGDISVASSQSLDVVMQWRLSRGYGLDFYQIKSSGRAKKKKKGRKALL